jgi:hypothetical protein
MGDLWIFEVEYDIRKTRMEKDKLLLYRRKWEYTLANARRKSTLESSYTSWFGTTGRPDYLHSR